MLGIRAMFRCVLLIFLLGTAGLVGAEPLSFDAALELATRSSPDIAVQIYTQATMTKMIAHCTQGGESIDQAIAWGADELEGFMRG